MQLEKSKRPFTLWVLAGLMLLIGIGAVISGPLLFLAPDGHLMSWSVDTLKGSPFPDFLIPGVILFLFVGVYPLFVAYSLLKQPRWQWPDKLNPLKRYRWPWSASLATGIVLLIWIVTETALLGYISFLQPVVTLWGVALIVLTLLPTTRGYYER